MPFINHGIFIHTTDYPAEAAVNYQLRYLLNSAILSLKRILGPYNQGKFEFDNEVQYYRFFTDHLMLCIGQINDLFVTKNDNETTNHYIFLNCKNYDFSKDVYPILFNKTPRNLMEHIFERNIKTIHNHKCVGGFNVLFIGMNKEIRNNIEEIKEYYPYTLDLENRRILFSDNKLYEDGSVDNYSIKLDSLMNELENLKKQVDSFENSLMDPRN